MKKDAIKLLTDWIEYSKEDFYKCPQNDLMSYGMGYGGWGVQTNQKGFAAVAAVGVKTKNKELIKTALSLLRFSLRSHISSDIVCFDGRKWGHTWISTLGIERMMHSVYMIMPYMTEEDKALLKTVLLSEADWLLYVYDIRADLEAITGGNRPESNMWNGAFLYRVGKMYPDSQNSNAYIKKGEEYFKNAISLPKDIGKDGVVGANFFESYALNHHGYLNIGYMAITLSHVAMLYFTCKEFGYEMPKNLFCHVEGLWKLLKSCTAPDGRLIRIGGDSRFRYCYCQDWIIPVWFFIKDWLHDSDCDGFLNGWMNTVKKEVKSNGDGSFLSDRCGKLKKTSPIYYTRLESDRAAAISVILAYEAEDAYVKTDVLDIWHDEFHGAAFVSDERNFRSFSWLGCDGPMGVAVAKDASDMAEWELNMVGEVKGIGKLHKWDMKAHKETIMKNAFVTVGKASLYGELFLAEQQERDDLGDESILYAALPDGATVVVFQKFTLPKNARSILTRVRGVNVKIPNDIYNDKMRTYRFEKGNIQKGMSEKEGLINLGKWINVDEKLGVLQLYGKEELKLYSPSKRDTQINPMHITKNTGIDTGNLYCDVVVSEFNDEYSDIWGDETVIDNGFAVVLGGTDRLTSAAVSENQVKVLSEKKDELRSFEVMGTDKKRYLIIANFGEDKIELKLDTKRKIYDQEDDMYIDGEVSMDGISAKLYCIE